MILSTILTWNYKGASSRAFQRHLRDLLQVHKPDIVILLETRCASDVVKEIFKFSCFNESIVSDACGYASGIWILWDRDRLILEPLVVHDKIVSILIRLGANSVWVLSAIYASPSPFFRQDLWSYIIQIGEYIQLPWLLLRETLTKSCLVQRRSGAVKSIKETWRRCRKL